MGLNTIPAVSGLTRNVVAFTSSQTWTVPSTAQYVDVLVVGGGSGGRGGYRVASNGGAPGSGGSICIGKNIYLGGTGTVAITVGAGSSGTTGTSTTTSPAVPSAAGYSGFGDLIYAGGAGGGSAIPGWAGYKGSADTYSFGVSSGDPSADSNHRGIFGTLNAALGFNREQTSQGFFAYGLDVLGLRGGYPGGYGSVSTTMNIAGCVPGGGDGATVNSYRLTTIPTLNWFNVNSYIGAATAGTTGGSGGTAGPAGLSGIGGGGGSAYYGTGQHGQGGPGAGGGGGNGGAQLGGSGIGGNGGNAGANTGAGGGGGGHTGSTTSGTGGTGGNGAAGIVLVSWLG